MRTEKELITSLRARQLLLKNVANRPLKPKVIKKYAQAMREGRLVPNGATICLNRKGELIDGQHRLSAIIATDLSFEMLIVYDLPDNAFASIDSGSVRSGGDVLAVIGEKNYSRLCAVLPFVDRYYNGTLDEYVRYDNDQILELNKKYPDVKEVLSISNKASKGFIHPRVLVACFYLFSNVDARLADDFIEKVVEGVNVVKGSSWWYLRERLTRNFTAKAKLSPIYVMALCIKAWNATRRGMAGRYLAWRETGEKAEAFPTIV